VTAITDAGRRANKELQEKELKDFKTKFLTLKQGLIYQNIKNCKNQRSLDKIIQNNLMQVHQEQEQEQKKQGQDYIYYQHHQPGHP
jgi:hypothetical protein